MTWLNGKKHDAARLRFDALMNKPVKSLSLKECEEAIRLIEWMSEYEKKYGPPR